MGLLSGRTGSSHRAARLCWPERCEGSDGVFCEPAELLWLQCREERNWLVWRCVRSWRETECKSHPVYQLPRGQCTCVAPQNLLQKEQ